MPLIPTQEQVVLALARNAGEDALRKQKDADSHHARIVLANSTKQDIRMSRIWALTGIIISIVIVLGVVWIIFR
jgi:hypothetical protein